MLGLENSIYVVYRHFPGHCYSLLSQCGNDFQKSSFIPCLQWSIMFSMCLTTETDQRPSLESKPATLGRSSDELHREAKTAGGLTFLRDF